MPFPLKSCCMEPPPSDSAARARRRPSSPTRPDGVARSAANDPPGALRASAVWTTGRRTMGSRALRTIRPRTRTGRHQAGLWGVVVIDGDTEGWTKRRARLLQGLEATGEAPLSSSDRILIMVPTRNIQTWGWVLLGNDADEQTDFAHRLHVPLRDVFAERWEPASPHELPSLIAGRAEWSRLP